MSAKKIQAGYLQEAGLKYNLHEPFCREENGEN